MRRERGEELGRQREGERERERKRANNRFCVTNIQWALPIAAKLIYFNSITDLFV